MDATTPAAFSLKPGIDVAGAIEAVQRWFTDHDLTFGHGTANARDEAAWLVMAVMDWPEDWAGCRPDTRQRARIVELAVRRVAERRPLAYLLKEGWLAGLRFFIDERVLVPRSPLAELIEQQLTPWVMPGAVATALDIGTGSGCLAIALARSFPAARIDAVDVDGGALIVARANVSRHQLAHRVRVLRSDLFAALPGRRYDVILANPPYVPAASMAALPVEFTREPGAALAAGEDGLDVARRILAQAGAYLTADGALFLEVGEAAEALVAAYPHVPFTWLEFARGGDGVLLLTADQLKEYFQA